MLGSNPPTVQQHAIVAMHAGWERWGPWNGDTTIVPCAPILNDQEPTVVGVGRAMTVAGRWIAPGSRHLACAVMIAWRGLVGSTISMGPMEDTTPPTDPDGDASSLEARVSPAHAPRCGSVTRNVNVRGERRWTTVSSRRRTS
jgi:hypothetical protein